MYRSGSWRRVGAVRARRDATTATGSLASSATVAIRSSVSVTAPFGAGVPYMLQVISQVEATAASGAGGRLETVVAGVTYRSDQSGNAASGGETMTFRGNEVVLVNSDAAQSVVVNLTAIGGALTVNTTGGEVIVIAVPYEAL